MPLEKVRKVLKIAKEPLSLGNPDRRRGGWTSWRTSSRIRTRSMPIDAAISIQFAREPRRAPAFASLNAARGACNPHALSAIGMNTDHTLEEVRRAVLGDARSASARSEAKGAKES